MMNGFLPVCKEDMQAAGLRQLDFVYVTGDAYVDHPAFGSAIISRLLESRGYSVGIIAQPDWRDPESVAALGEPRLGFLVSSGNMDSMVNHYTVAKKRRGTDAYSPGGKIGKRPDRAVLVYCGMIRRKYPHVPLIIGGLEASLRRLSHYDYWSDSVRRSVLLESGADLISYGMGERSIVEIADALASGLAAKDITWLDGTVFKTRDESLINDAVHLPDYEEVKNNKKAYAESFRTQYRNTDPFSARRLCERYDGKLYVVQNPPAKPLTEMEMDDVYALPYRYTYHPSYEKAGGIPALQEVRFSLTSNRGCFGGCNFCALTFHEGRIVQARSHASILREAEKMTGFPDFKGYIHDVGGPTAEFRRPACRKQLEMGACVERQCLVPQPCKNLEVDHSDYVALLRKLRALPGVKKVFVRSGIRFDYLMADRDRTFLRELCAHHISGQLRVAPEHVSDRVLSAMGKPPFKSYQAFTEAFRREEEKRGGSGQFLVPYLMSSHPGSTLKEALELALWLHKTGHMPEQVQDFYPTPGTVSTCMYHTGLDPVSMKPVYVAKDPHEKAMQRALMQYRKPENYALVKEALLKEGRTDLIGYGRECLIPPRPWKEQAARDGREMGKGRTSDRRGSRAEKTEKSRGHGKAGGRNTGGRKKTERYGRGR